ncbi:hypothetical protein [Phaeacidiphilus oryzae]|uniref:hypothetical protein n=1 Tax=Phaeacidiphilus oryzae TaxID=348818 RepID=UPI000564CC98|nr:hypothetical protein [Phaeacidiphilus oryzae]
MITVQVRGERGDIVQRAECRLDWGALQQVDEDAYPHLGGLLPYADTMFNARQAVRVRGEVGSRTIRELLGEEAAAEIADLCRTVEGGSHRYLWFLGD